MKKIILCTLVLTLAMALEAKPPTDRTLDKPMETSSNTYTKPSLTKPYLITTKHLQPLIIPLSVSKNHSETHLDLPRSGKQLNRLNGIIKHDADAFYVATSLCMAQGALKSVSNMNTGVGLSVGLKKFTDRKLGPLTLGANFELAYKFVVEKNHPMFMDEGVLSPYLGGVVYQELSAGPCLSLPITESIRMDFGYNIKPSAVVYNQEMPNDWTFSDSYFYARHGWQADFRFKKILIGAQASYGKVKVHDSTTYYERDANRIDLYLGYIF